MYSVQGRDMQWSGGKRGESPKHAHSLLLYVFSYTLVCTLTLTLTPLHATRETDRWYGQVREPEHKRTAVSINRVITQETDYWGCTDESNTKIQQRSLLNPQLK